VSALVRTFIRRNSSAQLHHQAEIAGQLGLQHGDTALET
jgi:hypothetical protein